MRWTQTLTANGLGMGLLALVMTMPLRWVRGLGNEGQSWRQTAISQIAQGCDGHRWSAVWC